MTQSIEGIRGDDVSAWFEAHIPGAQGPFSFSLIAGGHSNLTYAVDDAAGQRFVLRRPPLGHVLQSAHDVAREHRIISALASSAVPVAPADPVERARPAGQPARVSRLDSLFAVLVGLAVAS